MNNTPIQNLIEEIKKNTTELTIDGKKLSIVNFENIDFSNFINAEEALIKKCCNDSIINWKNGNIKIGISVGEQYFLEHFKQ